MPLGSNFVCTIAAPLWCCLGCCSRTVMAVKATANTRLYIIMIQICNYMKICHNLQNIYIHVHNIHNYSTWISLQCWQCPGNGWLRFWGRALIEEQPGQTRHFRLTLVHIITTTQEHWRPCLQHSNFRRQCSGWGACQTVDFTGCQRLLAVGWCPLANCHSDSDYD